MKNNIMGNAPLCLITFSSQTECRIFTTSRYNLSSLIFYSTSSFKSLPMIWLIQMLNMYITSLESLILAWLIWLCVFWCCKRTLGFPFSSTTGTWQLLVWVLLLFVFPKQQRKLLNMLRLRGFFKELVLDSVDEPEINKTRWHETVV